ncbi:MAG: thrombospondin type 3 repeat-containing protein [Patescibacteria group bacterium]|nr:thrombospondin type 3 repeat-containing protein [Patescibacteria group bacterium]
MKYQMRAIKNLIILLSLAVFFPAMCFASADLSVALGDVRFKPNNILAGQTVRIYVTIHNTGDTDTLGRVQIFDETAGIQISTDQPVSLIAGGADTIFADWIPLLGERRLRIKVTALSPDSNPKNDVVIQNVFADNDFDRDGIGDALDPDDDNDGVPDARDQFPKNAKEWQDTDSDGTGDNADTDDDNDGITDMDELKIGTSPYLKDTDGDKFIDSEDVFPLDAKEWLDTDKDGIGNNADPDDDNDNYCDQPPEISKVCKLNADNSGDRFPLDFKEWHDIDNDAIGDNVDKDNDNDSLNDVDEKVIGADPRNPDTDGDTYLDGLDAFNVVFFFW